MSKLAWKTKEWSSLRKALRLPPSRVTVVTLSQSGAGLSGGMTLPSILYTSAPASEPPSAESLWPWVEADSWVTVNTHRMLLTENLIVLGSHSPLLTGGSRL